MPKYWKWHIVRTSPTNRNRNYLAGNCTDRKYRMHHADMAASDPFQCRLQNKRTNNQNFAFGSSHARHTYILYALPLNNRHCLIRIHHPRQILQPGKVNWHRTEKKKKMIWVFSVRISISIEIRLVSFTWAEWKRLTWSSMRHRMVPGMLWPPVPNWMQSRIDNLKRTYFMDKVALTVLPRASTSSNSCVLFVCFVFPCPRSRVQIHAIEIDMERWCRMTLKIETFTYRMPSIYSLQTPKSVLSWWMRRRSHANQTANIQLGQTVAALVVVLVSTHRHHQRNQNLLHMFISYQYMVFNE